MALILCSNCQKEISDKAKACPHCGQTFAAIEADPVEVNQIVCEECGTIIPKELDACPNCGCPVPETEMVAEEAPQKVEVTAVNLPQMTRGAKKYIVIAVAAVLLIAAALFIGHIVKQNNLAKEAQRYANNLEIATYSMLTGAAEAEDVGNLIRSVWYNAIYEERSSETDPYTRPNGYFVDDFNTALTYLFLDSDFQEQISSIESNQELVSGVMKDLKNPPEEYEEAYDAIKEMYDAYTALTNLVIDPSGSLTTFSQSFREADNEVLNCYNAMEMYIEE